MKKAQGLSLNFVIVGIIALVVLVVVILIFTGGVTPVDKESSDMLLASFTNQCEQLNGIVKELDDSNTICGEKSQFERLGSVKDSQGKTWICCEK
ncbi:MAG TPA: hypothetical protein ENN46_04045 [Candidatus Woesearchaeota archaeon]|nr:hypothetical protein [Candidatus Woesearchaeota archaeon]